MFRSLSLLTMFVAAAILVGCAGDDEKKADKKDTPEKSKTETATVLCGTCGHEKGTDACCDEDAEACADCGLHKGSTLCCKDLGESKGKDICASCGHVAEDGHTCDADCEKCDKCGLHKGAPACCKLKAESDA